MESNQRVVFRKGHLVELRPPEESDIPLLVKWMNDLDVTHFLSQAMPVSLNYEKEWFANLHQRKNDVLLAIVVKGRLIGVTALHQINHIHQTANTGSYIGEKEYWSKGYGTEAKMLMLDFAFNTLNLRKILSSVIAYNGRSYRYLTKCGYKEEGIKRQQFYKDGQFHDEIMLAVFKEDWLPLWEAYKENHFS